MPIGGVMKRSTAIIVLTILSVLTLYPTLFVVVTSFKSLDQFFANFWTPSFPLHLHNYSQAWDAISGYMLNSVVVTLVSTLGVVVVSCMAAYAFARFDFPGREFFYYAVIVMLMIPAILTLIPSFLLIKDLGLMNTRWALILPYVAGRPLRWLVASSIFSSVALSILPRLSLFRNVVPNPAQNVLAVTALPAATILTALMVV